MITPCITFPKAALKASAALVVGEGIGSGNAWRCAAVEAVVEVDMEAAMEVVLEVETDADAVEVTLEVEMDADAAAACKSCLASTRPAIVEAPTPVSISRLTALTPCGPSAVPCSIVNPLIRIAILDAGAGKALTQSSPSSSSEEARVRSMSILPFGN